MGGTGVSKSQVSRLCAKIERPFRRLKGFHRILSRFEKLDLIFAAFIHFALIVDMLRVNIP
jgi:transposase